jgi:hypothetical protein
MGNPPDRRIGQGRALAHGILKGADWRLWGGLNPANHLAGQGSGQTWCGRAGVMSQDAQPTDRRERLARALRENLRRRKAQGRGRAAGAAPASAGGEKAADTRPVTGKTRDD